MKLWKYIFSGTNGGDRKKKFKVNDDDGVVEVQFLGIDKDVQIETGQNTVFKNLMVSVYENRTTLTNTANTMVEVKKNRFV